MASLSRRCANTQFVLRLWLHRECHDHTEQQISPGGVCTNTTGSPPEAVRPPGLGPPARRRSR